MADRSRNVLLCGFGAFGAQHAAAWKKIEGTTLSVCEPDEGGRARAIAAGIPEERVIAEIDAGLEGADLVDIVATPGAHLDLCRKALKAGKPIMVEKPAARTVKDADDLAGLVDRHALPVQVGMILRCHPLTVRAVDMLAEGVIGDLKAIEGEFCGWKRMRPDASLVENDGVHFLDLMRYLAGKPIAALDAEGRTYLGGEAPDDISVSLRLGNDICATLRLGVVAGGDIDDPFVPGAVTRKTLRLVGTGGIVELDFNRNRLFHAPVEYRRSPGGWTPAPGDMLWRQVRGASPVELIATTARHFLAALDGSRDVLCNVEQGTQETTRVFAAIETALQRQAPPMIAVEHGTSRTERQRA